MTRLRPAALALAAAAVAVAGWPATLTATDAACSVTASSLVDSLLNPPSGEDTDFFVTGGGVPNVVLLLDTSRSMVRLAPDGAARSWGSFEDLSTAGGYGCANPHAESLRFQSSCGTTGREIDDDLGNTAYDGSTDWAEQKGPDGKYCGYMDLAGREMATDKPGFDPDFYPTFFDKNRVYRDVVGYLPPAGDTNDLTPSRDGWTYAATNAAPETSFGDFCDRWQSDPARRSSCYSCLTTKGYWFDGDYLTTTGSTDPTATEDWRGPACSSTQWCQERGFGMCVKKSTETTVSGRCRIPNVWLAGNFLNFNPPKFLVARKVVKDVLAGVKLFRLGVYTLDTAGGGAEEIFGMNPACNMVKAGRSQFFNDRNAIKLNINNTNLVKFESAAPLAEALLDVGHLHATRSLPWFDGTVHDDSDFEEGPLNQRSVCFACQKSSVIFVSDGSPTYDGAIPGALYGPAANTSIADAAGNYGGMAGRSIQDISCPTCATAAEAADGDVPAGKCYGQQLTGACNALNDPIPSFLPKVAWYVHNMDLRADSENDAGGYPMTGKQSLDVFTIGLGVRNQQAEILSHTATAGGGKFFAADGARELRKAIDDALEEVSTRSVAFGSSSLSTLQASASQGVLVPRFVPSKKALWDGHLFSFDLWSEFTGGCSVPTTGQSGPANGDYDCDGKCTSVFLRDKNTADPSKPGDFIQEDAAGAFVKNSPANRAACGSGNLCQSKGVASPCGTASTTAAIPFWDAGDQLSPLTPSGSSKPATGDDKGFKSWHERRIYTVVDDQAPFKRFDGADTVLRVADDATTVSALLPYLNVKGNHKFCSRLANKLEAAQNGAGTTIKAEISPPKNADGTPGTPVWSTCAKVVVQYAMGADVFDERGCSTFPSSYCTRPYQLGDVFHSSPVEVWPPLPSDGLLCTRGLHPQCLPSLFSNSISDPSTASPVNANAYDDYSKHANYKHRNKFALFGANDGMLHAILTGEWHAGADDPKTPQKEDRLPFEGHHDQGTGEELWAFVPPDLLPKLHLLTGDTHHYFVDGTPMVRDVWIDGGTPNGIGGGSATKNGIREKQEFHTVAVVGERRGGNHYFALDVTDAGDDRDQKPRFLWLYPQADDREQLSFGESYGDFVPTPPPIGPVRIDAGAPPATGTCATFQTAAGATRCFEERWIVFLSGGYDPQYTRGRGVHMIDLGTGEELFDFSQPPSTSCGAGATDPKCALNFPVAATVGMMMWGKDAAHLSSSAAAEEGYFDTATFGDTGGQLWVLRFSDPGVVDPDTKKVGNWYGARIFQQGAVAAAGAVNHCVGQPFFHITSNLPLKANGLYRVLAGTGDRYNLLDPTGGVCSPTNLRACAQKGCTVSLDDGSASPLPGASFAIDGLGEQTYGMTLQPSCGATGAAFSSAASGSASATCSASTSRIAMLTISCPSSLVCSGSTDGETVSKHVVVHCTGDHCDLAPGFDAGSTIEVKNDTQQKNWFFSVQVFETGTTSPRGIFSTPEGAIDYDEARLDEDDLVSVNARDSSATATLATASDLGWKYHFDHGDPNTTGTTVDIQGISHYLYRSDERVASTTAVEAGCAFWNTLQVTLPTDSRSTSTDCPINSPCKAGKRQLSYLYGAHPATGDFCLYADGQLARSQRTEAIVPPHIGKLVAYVASGQVSFGLTSVRIPQGGSNISLGEARDVTELMEWVPLDRKTEKCRHSASSGAAPSASDCK